MSDTTPENAATPEPVDPTEPDDRSLPAGRQAERSPSGRHPTHVPHLVMGLALLGLVVVWALVVPLDAVDLPDARWLLPLPWLVAGSAGLIATVVANRRRP